MSRRSEAQLTRVRQALAARFDVEHELGSGGMATVYAAADLESGRRVAVKVLHPELTVSLGGDRFQREVAILSALDHPNILPVLSSGQASGLLYFTMPLASGATLRRRLDEWHRLPLRDAVAVLRDVAAAVDYAHERNIVHRDIKPENIVFEGERALVCDFGIARAIVISGGERLSSSDVAIGTAMYMSPEQAAAAPDVDGRADIYALGCVLYEMLAGTPPFTGSSRQAILARQSADTPPPLRTVRPDVPAEVEAAVLAALAKDRAARTASGAAFVRQLGS